MKTVHVSDHQSLLALLRNLPAGSEAEIDFDYGEGLHKQRRCVALGEPGVDRHLKEAGRGLEFSLEERRSGNGHAAKEWIVGVRVISVPGWGKGT